MFLTIVVFVLILGLLILSHEFGHFLAAKKAGMKVEEFGFGFPPRIFGIKKGETIYSLNLFPIGGFVKILGEQRPKKKEIFKKDERAFYNKPIWQRATVLAMGVIMNLFLAAALLSIVHGIGAPTVIEKETKQDILALGGKIEDIQIQIIEVAENSPAEEAGIKMGDTIKQLMVPTTGEARQERQGSRFMVYEVEDVQRIVSRYAGKEITLFAKRGDEVLEKTLTPRISPPENEGPIGIALAKTGLVSYPWYAAIWQGFKTTGQLIITFITLFYHLLKTLISKGVLISEIAGPVGIAVLTSQITKLGLVYILQFTAIISINLAIINAIPFPALDGGRLLFLAIEKIKRSPVSAKVENLVNGIGFALLIALMILVTFRDVSKLF